jgi:hypothetical protein
MTSAGGFHKAIVERSDREPMSPMGALPPMESDD